MTANVSPNNAVVPRAINDIFYQHEKRHNGATTTILYQMMEQRCWACYMQLCPLTCIFLFLDILETLSNRRTYHIARYATPFGSYR